MLVADHDVANQPFPQKFSRLEVHLQAVYMFHRCQRRETGQQGMAVRSRPGQALDGDCSADAADTVLDHHRLPQQLGERCR